MERRTGYFVKTLMPMVIAITIMYGLSFIVAQIMVAVFAYNFTGTTYEDFVNLMTSDAFSDAINEWTSISYSVIGALVFFIYYYTTFYKKTSKRFDATKPVQPGRELTFSLKGLHKGYLILGIVLLIIGMNLASSFIIQIINTVSPQTIAEFEELEQSAGIAGDNVSWVMILYAVLFGPICEELTYRAVTIEFGRRAMSNISTLIASSLLFAGMHMNIVQASYAFVIGMAFGYVYLKTGNIWITVVMHIIYNFTAMLALDTYLPLDQPVGFFLGLVATMCLIYAGILIFKSHVVLDEKKEDNGNNDNSEDEPKSFSDYLNR